MPASVRLLETCNQGSLPLYARLGFAEAARLAEPATGRACWLMVHPAHSHQAQARTG